LSEYQVSPSGSSAGFGGLSRKLRHQVGIFRRVRMFKLIMLSPYAPDMVPLMGDPN
jgi:hypothetical protein